MIHVVNTIDIGRALGDGQRPVICLALSLGSLENPKLMHRLYMPTSMMHDLALEILGYVRVAESDYMETFGKWEPIHG